MIFSTDFDFDIWLGEWKRKKFVKIANNKKWWLCWWQADFLPAEPIWINSTSAHIYCVSQIYCEMKIQSKALMNECCAWWSSSLNDSEWNLRVNKNFISNYYFPRNLHGKVSFISSLLAFDNCYLVNIIHITLDRCHLHSQWMSIEYRKIVNANFIEISRPMHCERIPSTSQYSNWFLIEICFALLK